MDQPYTKPVQYVDFSQLQTIQASHLVRGGRPSQKILQPKIKQAYNEGKYVKQPPYLFNSTTLPENEMNLGGVMYFLQQMYILHIFYKMYHNIKMHLGAFAQFMHFICI